MAHMHLRMKWQLIRLFPKLRKDRVAFLFVVFVIAVFMYYMYIAPPADDGTFIDLSKKRQLELIERYKKLKELENADYDEFDDKPLYVPIEELLNEDKKINNKRNENVKVNEAEDQKSPVHYNKTEKQKEILKLLSNTKKNLKHFDLKPEGLSGGKAQCALYDVRKENREEFDCIGLNLSPSVKVCPYPADQDIHVSYHIRTAGIWEPHIIKELQVLLFRDKDIGLIDIGAHIGMYSLVAGAMGHPVVAVEPFDDNLIRLHKAIKLAKIEDKITVIRNAISDERRHAVPLKLYKDNQGGTSLLTKGFDPCEGTDRCPEIRTILMDDLLEVINFKKAIIKIDIEGHEHRAFKYSSKLFHKLNVMYIFMEWLKLRSYYGSEADHNDDKDSVFDLVDQLVAHGFIPHSSVTGVKLKTAYWYAWPDDIIWKHELADLL